MKFKVVLSSHPTSDVLLALQKEFVVISDGPDPINSMRLLELVKQHSAHAVFLINGIKIGPEEIAEFPQTVKIVATQSVGYDHLDVSALTARQILATNTPDVLTDATADAGLVLLLGAARRLRESIQITDNGWGKKLGPSEMLGLDLRGKKLGIFGMGRIGQAMAKRAQAFGMEILYCNRKRLPADQEMGAKYFTNFHEMLPHCQFISLNAPGGAASNDVMGAKEFALLPNDAVFINVSRGSLVDEEALFAALDSGKLFAAGIDVCKNEPIPDPRFLMHPRILFTPHVGSATRETRHAMGMRAFDNIRAALAGEVPRDRLC